MLLFSHCHISTHVIDIRAVESELEKILTTLDSGLTFCSPIVTVCAINVCQLHT